MSSGSPRRIAGRRPTAGVPGHLRTKDGQTVEVSIAERGNDLLLVLLVNPGPLLDVPAADLLLESMTSRGLVRLHGNAQRVDRDLVRFTVDGAEEVVQRREFVRVVAPQRVTLDDACGTVTDTRSINISGGGMLLSGPETLDLDEEVNFRLYLDESGPPIGGIGRVIRASKDKQRAIVFEHIDDADRDRLIHFIFERQRRALAITRGDSI